MYFDNNEQRWAISDEKVILCRTAKGGAGSALPPLQGWEYWKVSSGTYIPSANMKLSYISTSAEGILLLPAAVYASTLSLY